MSDLARAVDHVRRHRRVTSDPAELTLLLYQSWYARPLGSAVVPEHFPADLVQVLRAADETGRVWEGGWSVDRVSGTGSVIARRGEEVRLAERCDYVAPEAPGVVPRPGDALLLAGRRDRVDPDGSWWRTGGRSWMFTRSHPDLVRLYWNFGPVDLPEVVGRLTAVLADSRQPWMLKCAANPDVHARADATVLFLSRDALDGLAPAIDDVASVLAPRARRGAPPLTLPVRAGVAAAVDPGEDTSFGEHRCRLIVDALTVGPDLGDALDVAAVEAYLAAREVHADRPWALRHDPLLPWER